MLTPPSASPRPRFVALTLPENESQENVVALQSCYCVCSYFYSGGGSARVKERLDVRVLAMLLQIVDRVVEGGSGLTREAS